MGKKSVSVMVEGGKATAAPPVGPTLAPLGVNVGKIVAEINKKTEDLKGMQVPVIITVDEATKEFSLTIGTPPTSALIKKELGLKKGSGKTGSEVAGEISLEQAKKVAKAKFGSDEEPFVSQVLGTGRSMGVKLKG